MTTSGEAADQVVKMMLEGTEVLIRLSGSGAKHTAVLLYSILREQKKTQGAARVATMLRSGKPLRVYTFGGNDLEKFKDCAKQYGVLYAILKERDKTGGVFDVLVKAEDENKLARIVERFGLAQVDTASLRAEIARERKTQGAKPEQKSEGKPEEKPQSEEDRAVEELFRKPEGEQERQEENPGIARTEDGSSPAPEEPLSGHSYAEAGNREAQTTKKKPSVRKRMEQIRARRAESAKAAGEAVREVLPKPKQDLSR